jgi:hypothetical protein
VRADTWAATLGEALEFPGTTGFTASLSSPGGYSLPLVSAPEQDAPADDDNGAEQIRFTSSVARAGWRMDLAVNEGVLSVPVDAVLWKFLYLGLALVALTLGPRRSTSWPPPSKSARGSWSNPPRCSSDARWTSASSATG